MKLKRIHSIQNIRNFLDFEDTQNELSCYFDSSKNKIIECYNTIIYAPNWVWKTNISRFFHYLSNWQDLINLLSQEANDINDIAFSFTLWDLVIDHTNVSEHVDALSSIHVFNADYVESNIKMPDFSTKDLSGDISVPIWEFSIRFDQIQDRLKELDWELITDKENLNKNIEKDIKALREWEYKGSHPSLFTEFSMWKILDKDLNIIKPEYIEGFTSCEESFKKIKWFTAADKLNTKYHKLDIEFHSIIEEIKLILNEAKIFVDFSKETETNIKFITTKWLNDQWTLHSWITLSKEKDKCLLCKRTLDDSANALFDEYLKYFDNEKSKYEKRIDNYIWFLTNSKETIEKINNDEEEKIKSYLDLFVLTDKYSNISTESLLIAIASLIDELETKKNDPSILMTSKYNCSDIYKNIEKQILSNEKTIENINKKIISSSDRETILRKMIWKKYLYYFYQKNISLFDNISLLIKERCTLNKELNKEKNKLPKHDLISNVEELMNSFLSRFLEIGKYSVSIEWLNPTLYLKLNNLNISSETHKISEWEKNMIWLCYFLASSIQKFDSPEKFEKGIFIIDDPICSTSYSNFFGICNLIDNFDTVILRDIFKSTTINTNQKIILTHNTQFLNMIRSNTFKDKRTLYFILNSKWVTKLKRKRLISEFETCLYRIYKASINEDDSNIGNDMRRFFETIRHFYGFNEFNADSLKSIFPSFNEDDFKIFYSASNYYSHWTPEAHSDPLPPENLKKLLDEFVQLIESETSMFKGLWENKIKVLVTV